MPPPGVRLSSPAEATAIVLAGGRSRRFGRDKLLEPYRGVPMLNGVIGRVAEVCPHVVVVAAAAGSLPGVPSGLGVRVVRDAREDQGPLAGLATGLSAARGRVALVAAGDMPDLRVPVLRALLEAGEAPDVEAVALQEGTAFRPLPCVVAVEPARRTAERLLEAGERRLRALLGALRLAVVPEDRWVGLDPERRTLLDVDEPADLERLDPGR
ncbi:MAG TPA: molybdenum cofactor guanylyltransferase [Actinomycetota bacterium]|nr:molybdenum cofactor guanylyltransferase [Actinomycetota bacterium]